MMVSINSTLNKISELSYYSSPQHQPNSTRSNQVGTPHIYEDLKDIYLDNEIDQSNQSGTYDHLNFSQQEVNCNERNYKRKLIIYLTILTLILISITIVVVLSFVLTLTRTNDSNNTINPNTSKIIYSFNRADLIRLYTSESNLIKTKHNHH